MQLQRSFAKCLAIFTLLAIVLLTSCAIARQDPAEPSGATLQLRVIEFRDHPDPHTGTIRVIDALRRWPVDVEPLLAAVSKTWVPVSVYGMRRVPMAVGATEKLEETGVRVVGVERKTAKVRLTLDSSPQPIDLDVPIDGTLVIGSEADEQRHAFVALSIYDSEAMSEVYSTRESGVVPPVKLNGDVLVAPAGAVANGQKGVIIDLEIDEHGNVVTAHVLGARFLSAADVALIENLVGGWKFKPATRNGKPVRVVTAVPAAFGR